VVQTQERGIQERSMKEERRGRTMKEEKKEENHKKVEDK